MKREIRIFLSVLLAALLAACSPTSQDANAVAVIVSLTQTAAVIASPATTIAPIETGVISGMVSLMAPPTPAMTVYAVDPATGKWYSVEAPANDTGPSSFTLSVPPGSYQVFAGSAAAFSIDGMGLSPVTVPSNQTISGIMVQFVGQGDCGSNFAMPASPDGKYKGLPGPDQACLANLQAEQSESQSQPTLPPPTRIDVLPSGSWSTQGIMQPNTHPYFIFAGAKDKILTITVTLNPNAGASAFVNTAGGMIMASNITSTWSTKLPAKVDYIVGIDNNTLQDVSYTLNISITTPNN